MSRLKQLLADGIDPTHNYMYSLIVKGFISITDLEASLEEILSHLLPAADRNLSRFLQVQPEGRGRANDRTNKILLTYPIGSFVSDS